MTAAEFMNEMTACRLGGRDLLIIMQRICPPEKIEGILRYIKETPRMPISDVIRLLDESELGDAEYNKMIRVAQIKCARSGAEAPEIKKSEPSPPSAPTAGEDDVNTQMPPPSPRAEVTEVTESATIPEPVSKPDPVPESEPDTIFEPSREEKTETKPRETEFEPKPYTPELSEELTPREVYGERENAKLKLICLVLVFVLFFGSFALRYVLTGTVALPPEPVPVSVSDSLPHSAAELLDYLKTLNPNGKTRPFITENRYKADNFGVFPIKPADICSAGDYIYKVSGNSFYSVKAVNAKLSAGRTVRSGKGDTIIGIFTAYGSLYAVYNHTYAYEEKERDSVLIKVYDTSKQSVNPYYTYVQDGVYVDISISENNIVLVTDFDTGDGIASYSVEKERREIPIQSTYIYDGTKTGRETLLGNAAAPNPDTAEDGSITANVCAIVGGDSVVFEPHGGKTLFFVNENTSSHMLILNSETMVLESQMLLSGNGFSGCSDLRSDILRVVIRGEDGCLLYVFDENMKVLAAVTEIAKAENGKIKGTAFSDTGVYIVGGGTLYGIDTEIPSAPAVMQKPDREVSVDDYYKWSDNELLRVYLAADADNNRQGITVEMYKVGGNGKMTPLSSETFTPAGERVTSAGVTVSFDFNASLTSPLEESRDAVAVYSRNNCIIIPVSYTDTVTNESVYKFIFLGYNDIDGFIPQGELLESGYEDDGNYAIIKDGYIYAFWGGKIKSADVGGKPPKKIIDTLSR